MKIDDSKLIAVLSAILFFVIIVFCYLFAGCSSSASVEIIRSVQC